MDTAADLMRPPRASRAGKLGCLMWQQRGKVKGGLPAVQICPIPVDAPRVMRHRDRMNRVKIYILITSLALGLLSHSDPAFAFTETRKKLSVILISPEASSLEQFAAKELRKYIYLRTDYLMPIVTADKYKNSMNGVIIVANCHQSLVGKFINNHNFFLKPDSYSIQPIEAKGYLLVTGGNDVSLLYAVYHLAGEMGVWFSIHGDTFPDSKKAPYLDFYSDEVKPRIPIRGLLPFHDFPEGPDWWVRDDYLALVEQMPKLRLNFLGFHTYPEGEVGAEPTVWIGPKNDVLTSGVVKSAYPARYFSPLSGTWQYQPMRTSDYRFGVSEMFDRDDFSGEVMEGMTPWPPSEDAERELFRRTGLLYADVFARARELGIQTCVGTELPLTVPKAVRTRMGLPNDGQVPPEAIKALYEGMFHRLQTLSPVDYYWFWSPESWLWGEVKAPELAAVQNDLSIALAALNQVKPAIRPVISGWVLGPQQDPFLFHRTLPMNVILAPLNKNLGLDPIDKNLSRLHGRDRWAITWLEDDGAMTVPQLWAGRAAKDVNDAIDSGCTGVIGLFWRTAAIAPTVKAFSNEMWSNTSWEGLAESKDAHLQHNLPGVDGRSGGFPGLYLGREISHTAEDYIYQSQWYDLTTYTVVLPPGAYTVRLHFAELIEELKPGDRVFDVAIQGKLALENFDLIKTAGPNAAHIAEFQNVTVTSSTLTISFTPKSNFTCIAAVEAIGPVKRAINCAGKTFKNFESDQWPPTPSQLADRNDDPSSFYQAWVKVMMGSLIDDLSNAFISNDGRMARAATWTGGPGGLVPDYRPEHYPNEGFPDINRYTHQIEGSGSRHRFDYWDLQFQHLALIDRITKQWGDLKVYFNSNEKNKTSASTKLQALIDLCAEDMALLRRVARTKGDLGTIANLQQHSFPNVIDGSIRRFEEIFGEKPAVNLAPNVAISSPIPLIVPTVRTRLAPGEPLRLTVIAPGADGWSGVMRWRPMGRGDWQSVAIPHVGRAVHKITWQPPATLEDFEYYLEFTRKESVPRYFPVTAPSINQAVIIH